MTPKQLREAANTPWKPQEDLGPRVCPTCRGRRGIYFGNIQLANCPDCCRDWVANGTCCWVSCDSPGDHADDCPEASYQQHAAQSAGRVAKNSDKAGP